MTAPDCEGPGRRDCDCPVARHRHGTSEAYRRCGCRGSACRAAACATETLRYRLIAYGQWEPFAEATGSARRLQALARIGWSTGYLSTRLGCSDTMLTYWQLGKYGKVTRATADRIAALYDELWDTPSPRAYSDRVRRLASERRWSPPLAWDDDTIDDPAAQPATGDHSDELDEVAIAEAMNGRPVRLTKPERVEAVRRLTNQGLSAAHIGERLHTTSRTVQRRRAAA